MLTIDEYNILTNLGRAKSFDLDDMESNGYILRGKPYTDGTIDYSLTQKGFKEVKEYLKNQN